MSGIFNLADESCSPCEELRNERDSTIKEIKNLSMEIEKLEEGIAKISKDNQRNANTSQGRYQSIEEKLGILSRELKAANETHLKDIKDLHRENKKLQEDLYKSNEEGLKLEKYLEKSQRDLENVKKDLACENERVKGYEQKFQELSTAKEKLENEEQLMREQLNSLQEDLSKQRSTSDNLKKEVHRLRLTSREMPGGKWLLQFLPHCMPRLKKSGFVLDF